MSEMTLLDKAADALRQANWGRDFDPKYTWGGVTEGHKNVWRAQALSVARVILSAPASEGMKSAYHENMGHFADNDWRKLSSALLSELSGSAERGE